MAIKVSGGLVVILLILLQSVALAKNDASSSISDTGELLSHPEKIQTLLKQKKITEDQIPNPHWRAEGCLSCHAGKASSADKNLRSSNINDLCNSCHKTGDSHSIIHPVGVLPSKNMFRQMPTDFQEALKHSGGKMDCLTCHDVEQACNEEREQVRSSNQLFFRGGNYENDRTRLCFYCHDEGQYERLNPHKQVRKDGSINEQACYVCHEDMPDGERITNIGQLYFNVEDNYSSIEDDYSQMCNGCHPWKPHPGGTVMAQPIRLVNHLITPPDKMMRQIKQSKIYLPLEPGTQRIFCGTCHNAHDKGVIKRPIASQGAGSKHFLRDQNLCVHCHAK